MGIAVSGEYTVARGALGGNGLAGKTPEIPDFPVRYPGAEAIPVGLTGRGL